MVAGRAASPPTPGEDISKVPCALHVRRATRQRPGLGPASQIFVARLRSPSRSALGGRPRSGIPQRRSSADPPSRAIQRPSSAWRSTRRSSSRSCCRIFCAGRIGRGGGAGVHPGSRRRAHPCLAPLRRRRERRVCGGRPGRGIGVFLVLFASLKLLFDAVDPAISVICVYLSASLINQLQTEADERIATPSAIIARSGRAAWPGPFETSAGRRAEAHDFSLHGYPRLHLACRTMQVPPRSRDRAGEPFHDPDDPGDFRSRGGVRSTNTWVIA